MKKRSTLLLEKSVASAVSAIEIYNKPSFEYREETFAILMTNAWELLLKAKILEENNNRLDSLYVKEKRKLKNGSLSSKEHIKPNRSGNPMTLGFDKTLSELENKYHLTLDPVLKENLLALIEIRDNAIHFKNRDFLLSKKVLEIGTASLKNYLFIINSWFNYDLSKFNFYLMPLAFFSQLDEIQALGVSNSREVQSLLNYIVQKERDLPSDPENDLNFAVTFKMTFIRSSDEGLSVRQSDDPNAIPVSISEEDFRKKYPWSYEEVTKRVKDRYPSLKLNMEFHTIMAPLKKQKKYCSPRYLDPDNAKSGRKDWYNPNILQELDKVYSKDVS